MTKKKKLIIIIAAVTLALIIAAVIIVINVNKNKDDSKKKNEDTSVAETAEPEDSTAAESQGSDEDGNAEGITPSMTNHKVVGSIKGDGYEGIEGTGKYNYGEALQKSLLFYELQRSGQLPETVRCNWRGDSALNDGKDVGLDLTGGWYDAGDNVKFNLPMAYTASMLGWSIYEDRDAYEESKQLTYAMENVKWACDYFIKCHPKDEVYYYQVGDGNSDHSWWGSAELVETKMERPAYCVTADKPGSAVTGEAAAALAVCSIIYKDTDAEYSAKCLEHARSLYAFANKYKSDAGYTAANGFYNSWSGFYDELAFSGAWLYIATNDKTYLNEAKDNYSKAGHDLAWAMCWDDVHVGAALLLARITGEDIYKKDVEDNLDFWTVGCGDKKITYSPKGLAWLDSWGSLRYASTTAFIACVYSDWQGCPSSKKSRLEEFALSQINYILGDTGSSFMIGFGENYPVNPHHRTAQGSYCDNMNEPSPGRHILFGALVGGPDSSDSYADKVSDYCMNEVACDYNAGFTGALAKMYKKYHGKTIKNFGAVETIKGNEYSVEAGINAEGSDFIEIKAIAYNMTGWPARRGDNVELRYFIDLSEIVNGGGKAADVEVTTNYMKDATADGIKVWDEKNNIYYLSVNFDGKEFYPGGQEKYKKEIQVRLKSGNGTWDNSNDPSFEGLTTGSLIAGEKLALYEDGKLVYGTEPPKGDKAGQSVVAGEKETKPQEGNTSGNSGQTGNTGNSGQSGSTGNGLISVSMNYSNSNAGGSLKIKNTGSSEVKITSIRYYLNKDKGKTPDCIVDNGGINLKEDPWYISISGSDAKAEIKSANSKEADTLCEIKFSNNCVIGKGGELTLDFRIINSDYSSMNTGDDYSGKSVENIVIMSGNNILSGKAPK